MTDNKIIWFSWENQRRNRELSKALGARLFEFAEIDQIKNPLRKYPLGIYKTLKVIIKYKPRLIYAQNPSLILSALVILIKYVLKYKVTIDAHNIGLSPDNKILKFLSKFIQQKADLIIVSNNGLKDMVQSNGGNCFVLPDKIPEFNKNNKMPLKGDFNVLFICSFAMDEPYLEVIQAARLMDGNIFIYITGNYHKVNLKPDKMPSNVILTGYIPEKEYISLLYSVDAVIDLTTRENCLVCGAYEGLAAGKPLILSNTHALQNYFYQGVIFIDNSAAELVKAIHEMIYHKKILENQVFALKKYRIREWEKLKNNLQLLQNSYLEERD